MRTTSILTTIAATGAGIALLIHGALAISDSPARDPGVRTAGMTAGDPIAGLTPGQWSLFNAGKTGFNEEEGIARGLGPTMNYNSCGGCHAHPATGGSSPPINPQVAFANEGGARNAIPSFISRDGPVRVARFIRNADGTPLFPLAFDANLFYLALVLATLTGLLAAFAPALRAARLDPVVAIRG